jgi:chemotaxis signal transduction protein
MIEEEEVAETNRAWLLDFGDGLQAAVGHHEMLQVVISPTLFDIPCVSPYCSQVLILQGRILPVFSVPSLLLEKQQVTKPTGNVIGVAIYQDDPDPIQPLRYAGLHLATTPQSIYVSDDQACDLADHQYYWETLAWSCFSLEGVPIPIIDFTYLFSVELNSLKAGESKV